MIGKGEPLHRIVNRGPDVRQSGLNRPIANRPQDIGNSRSDQDQREDDLHVKPRRKGNLLLHIAPQICDGIANELRQAHVDAQIDQQH